MEYLPFERDPKDESLPTGETTPKETLYEEFDISSFDFTIADPGDQGEYTSTRESSETAGEPESEASALSEASGDGAKGKKISFARLSASFSDKVARMMEDTPKEPQQKKKTPPLRETELLREAERQDEEPAVEAEAEAPVRKEGKKKAPKTEAKTPRSLREMLPWIPRGNVRQISRRWLRYALRPATLYENISEVFWPLFLAGGMAYFALFYLMIGLDWYFAGLTTPGKVWAVTAAGLLVGGTAVTAFAAGAQGLSLLCRKEKLRPFRVFSAVAGACVYPSSLLILGFLIQVIFRASVSMSFGIMSLLWTAYNLLDVLREQMGEKHLFKSVLLTVLWGFLLFNLMSLTFTLK